VSGSDAGPDAATERLATRLEVAADRLEEGAEPGPSALFRALAYLIRRRFQALPPAIDALVRQLRGSGMDELLEEVRPHFASSSGYLHALRGMPREERSALMFGAWPASLSGAWQPYIDLWRADPRPKLPGLEIRVRPVSESGRHLSIRLTMAARSASGRHWNGSSTIAGRTWAMLPEARRVDLVFRVLDEIHDEAVRQMRQEWLGRRPDGWPTGRSGDDLG
jgi:hypothetical protein